MTHSLQNIRQISEAIELLSEYFDFNILATDESDNHDWFVMEPTQNYAKFATDGAGGCFALLEDTGWILYVSSEGEAGIVALNLTDLIQLIVTCPYWNDLLKFSGGGQLYEMKRALPVLKDSLHKDEPEIKSAQKKLRKALGINAREIATIEALHFAITSTNDKIWIKGEAYSCGPLFNTFTIDNLILPAEQGEECLFSVSLSDDEISIVFPGGQNETMRLSELREISITNNPDTWIQLINARKECSFPFLSAPELVAKLFQLPGFDHDAFIQAMTSNARTSCWKAVI